MIFSEYIKRCKDLIKRYPECKKFQVIYSTDDEGNEYNKCNSLPFIVQVENINDNRFLEIVGFYDDLSNNPEDTKDIILKDCNAVIIN